MTSVGININTNLPPIPLKVELKIIFKITVTIEVKLSSVKRFFFCPLITYKSCNCNCSVNLDRHDALNSLSSSSQLLMTYICF